MTTEIFTHSMTQLGKVGAWSRYVMPFKIEDWSILGDEMYFHTGNAIHVMRLSEMNDQDESGATIPIVAEIQSHYLDCGAPGITKQMIGFDLCGNGTASVSFGINQNDLSVFTPPATIPADTIPGMVIPIPLMAPSFSLRLTYSSFDNPNGWEWLSSNFYLNDARMTA